MRVLYVDDEPDLREIARMSLELDQDFRVEVASSGNEAIRLVGEFRPDIIVLDVMMPDMDGVSTLNALKREYGSKLAPVIFITARTQTHEIEGFRSFGVTSVITKPFDAMTLARQVRDLSGL